MQGSEFISWAEKIRDKIFDQPGILDDEEFLLEIFRYQSKYVKPYKEFTDKLNIDPEQINSVLDIPFLPVELFKSHVVKPDFLETEISFSSSSTTGTGMSYHHVVSKELYEQSFIRSFDHFYGDPSGYAFFALLPSYLERQGSSLIFMVDKLIQLSQFENSGYFLNDYHELKLQVESAKAEEKKVIILGVTYALLDMAEQISVDLSGCTVMETGGMKGRRKELLKDELHTILCERFNIETIHSEYGMTELLSQAYSSGAGKFRCPPWMRVIMRDLQDPLLHGLSIKRGAINVIDLANLYSCSFIATQDLGEVYQDGSFSVQGRMTDADIRGCNLLVQ